MLLLFLGFLLASLRAEDVAQSCYLSGYNVGESFLYHYESDFQVEKAVEHGGSAEQRHKMNHYVEVDASIQCVGIAANGEYNFELRVHRASWRRPQSADHYDSDEVQAQIDEQFTASLQRPFYYAQRCNMEIVNVFHPHDESEVTLNIKKNLVHAFDNELTHTYEDEPADDDASTATASDADADGDAASAEASATATNERRRKRSALKYVKRRVDQLGEKTVQYEHQLLDDGSLQIDMSHSHDRQLHIVDATHRKNRVALGSSNSKRTTLRSGVVHSVEKNDAAHFPTAADDTPDPAKRQDHDPGTFRFRSQGSGTVRLVTEGDSRTRAVKMAELHAPNPLPRSFTDAHRALRARHINEKLDIVARSPTRTVPRDDGKALPPLDTAADVRALLSDVRQFSNILRWLRRDARNAITRLAAACVEINTDDARLILIRALGTADVPLAEQALVNIIVPESKDEFGIQLVPWTVPEKDVTLIVISLLANPSTATLDALEHVMTNSDVEQLSRQAALVFGIAAASHHHAANGVGTAAERAQRARMTLAKRLVHSVTNAPVVDEDDVDAPIDTTSEVFALSLRNAMKGDIVDEHVYRVLDEHEKRQANGGDLIRNFLADAKCPSVSACSSKTYDVQRPATVPKKQWNDTFGVEPFSAYLETILDYNADRSPSGKGYYRGFAGAKIDARAFKIVYPVASAYGKASFQYANQVKGCANYSLELYFQYLNNAYYFKAGRESNCTEVASTCEPNRPRTYALYNFLNSADPSMPLKFWSYAAKVEVAFIDVTFDVKAEGSLGFNYDWRFNVAPTRGGVALNGFVQPHARATLTASVGLVIVPDLLGITAIAELELLNSSLPVTAAVNANTLQGCTRIIFLTNALGGSLAIEVLFVVGKFKHTVYTWKGFGFETNLMDTKCCIECKQACYNAYCNYEKGECVCDMWHDGDGCDIDCPPACQFSDAAMSNGITCVPAARPDRGERQHCKCANGYYGWNCKSQCPPGNLMPAGPNRICSGHGECDGQGLCKCENDYFGADCSITCPITDPASGERCGANGRCVFNGESAKCECFANFVGAKCEARCPVSQDKRAAPCSRRGDCSMIDGKPSCMCFQGFYGDVCENIDVDGSGTALKLFGQPMPVQFDDARELDALANVGTAHTGVWFVVDELPEVQATIVSWKQGRLLIDKNAALKYCSERDGDCVEWRKPITTGKWYFASVVLRHAAPGYELHMRLSTDAESLPHAWDGAPVDKVSSDTFTLVVKSGVALGAKFNGRIDLLSLSFKKRSAASDGDFSEGEIVQMRDEIVPSTQPGLMFYCDFDLKRGSHLYDEVHLLRGSITEAGGRFVDSEIELGSAALLSQFMVPFDIDGGAVKSRTYKLTFDGKLYSSGALAFGFMAPLTLCTVRCKINGIEALANFPAVTGSGITSQPLSPFVLEALRNGDNTLDWSVTPASCKVSITESRVTLAVPAVDAVADFSGSPYSYIKMARAFPFRGSWTVDMWVYRDRIIYTQNGKLVSLVSPTDVGARTKDTGSILIYETGSTGRGVEVGFPNGRLRYATFSTPVGVWFHYVVAVQQSGSSCTLNILIDGNPIINNLTPVTVDCGPTAAVDNGAVGQYELRIGSAFAGRVNDLRFRNVAWFAPSDVRKNMFSVKTFDEPSLLAAYSFDEAAATTIFDSRKSAVMGVNNGEIQEGTFRALIYGIDHLWQNCPGTSYFSPEAVCSTLSIYEHGYCTHERDSEDFECTCNPGFLLSDCSGVCPGGAGNICSNHGECFTFNDTFCVCNEGYVGPACEFECPGINDPQNTFKKSCFGHGQCSIGDDGLSAKCTCDSGSSRYGPFCQYTYGGDPVASIVDQCKNCDGPHKLCRDGVCVCEQGYYEFFQICKPNGAQRGVVLSALSLLFALLIHTLL